MDRAMSDRSIFESTIYEFLAETVSSKAQKGLRTFSLRITCFDVNRNYFVFGSNIGAIYCFGRRQSECVASQIYQKCQLISSAITRVTIISDYLVSFTSDFAIYVVNWKTNQFFYCWKTITNSKLTATQTYVDIDQKKVLLISGDSLGVVRSHDITTGEQIVIFVDNSFEIIQIEFIDRNTVIISSTLRTVILKLNASDECLVQIGKNERKKLGKYGAIYSVKDNVVYACRPALHLSKADVITGDVIETIRINRNISESNTIDLFVDVVNGESKNDKNIYKLGVLSSFCGDNYLISCNNSYLLIVESNGEFCFKAKIDDLIEVKTPHRRSNEVFLLLNSRQIIRLQHKSWSSSLQSDNNTSDDIDLGLDLLQTNSSDWLLNLFSPINSKVVSFIDEEVKRAFDMFNSKVAKKFDQLSTSISLSINSNNYYDSEVNMRNNNLAELSTETETVIVGEDSAEEQDLSPIVVTRKNKKRHQEKERNNSHSSDSLSRVSIEHESLPTNNSNHEDSPPFVCDQEKGRNNSDSNSYITDSLSRISIEHESLSANNSNLKGSPPLVCAESLSDEVSDDRLQAILNAYKEANRESKFENFSDNDSIIENFDITNNNEVIMQVNDSVAEVSKSDEKTSDNKVVTNIDLNWNIPFNLIGNLRTTCDILSLCVNGYDSNRGIGPMWLTATEENEPRLLFACPTLHKPKLPPKSHPSQITANEKELYMLCTDGNIYKKEGINSTKPLGSKWTNVKMCKSKSKLKSISLNNSNGIIWCCDENGEAWTFNTKNQIWRMINDFSSHSIEFSKVCVAFNDHSIVWAIDKRGKIFVRLFKSDGDEWLLVDGILATDLVVCNHYVWIVVDRSKLYRRSNRCDTNYNINDWRRVNIPFDEKDDSFQALSISENNELWIVSVKSEMCHSVNDDSQQSRDVDMGWFLV